MVGSLLNLKSTVPVGLLLRLDLNDKNGTISISTTELTATRRRRSLQCLSATTEPPTTNTTEIATTGTSSSSKLSGISSADYLVQALDLPPESALTITEAKHKHIRLKSTANADSVLSLFRDFGFSNSELIGIFSKRPRLFQFDAHKNLKPKLDYLTGSGISGEDLVRIITTDPYILQYSLDRVIIPCISFLKSFWGCNGLCLVSELSAKSGTRVLRNFSKSLPHNVQVLQSYGVPDSNILKMMRGGFGTCPFNVDVEQFSEAVREAKEMGFDPSSMSMLFVRAVTAIAGRKEKLVARFELLKSFGWTDEQVNELFLREPRFFNYSEQKLKTTLEFFMNELHWSAHDVIKYPDITHFSFANRILPRFSVLQILISKGLEKKTCTGRALQAREDVFLRKYVEKYQVDIPQLLEVYQEKKKKAGAET